MKAAIIRGPSYNRGFFHGPVTLNLDGIEYKVTIQSAGTYELACDRARAAPNCARIIKENLGNVRAALMALEMKLLAL